MLIRIYYFYEKHAILHVLAADSIFKIIENRYMKCTGIFRKSIFVILFTYIVTSLKLYYISENIKFFVLWPNDGLSLVLRLVAA